MATFKLINADDLIAKLNEMSNEPDYQHPDEDWCCGVYMALGAVQEAPAIEAVPVVRCKNCKYGDYYGCSNDMVYCMVHSRYTNVNDFCSYGEKEE